MASKSSYGGGRMARQSVEPLIKNPDGSLSRASDLLPDTNVDLGGHPAGARHFEFRTTKKGYTAPGNMKNGRQVLDDVEEPDGYWDYYDSDGELAPDAGDFQCPNLRTDPEQFEFWYLRLRWIHLGIAVVLLTIFGIIVGYAAADKLTGRVYSTTDFLQANPGAPPALATTIDNFHAPHLYWLFLVPLICGLGHLALGFPSHWFGEILPGDKSEAMRNPYGEIAWATNRLYKDWFYKNVVHEMAGVKHFPYAFCYGFLVTGIGFVVGVTNVFLQISLFILAFVSSLGLWYMEYGNGSALKGYYQQKMRMRGSGMPEDVIAQIFSMLARPVIQWLPYIIAMVSEILVFVILWSYFGTMLAHNSSHIHWYVWYSMIFFTFIKTFEFMSIVFYWFDFYIFRCYIWMETTHLIMHAITFGSITAAIVFGSMDDGQLYA